MPLGLLCMQARAKQLEEAEANGGVWLQVKLQPTPLDDAAVQAKGIRRAKDKVLRQLTWAWACQWLGISESSCVNACNIQQHVHACAGTRTKQVTID